MPPKINPADVMAQVLGRKVDRVDIQMLLALEAAPKYTLRLEDRINHEKQPPAPGAPLGTPPKMTSKLSMGLESLVNEWCDSRPDLCVIPQTPLVERHAKTGEELKHPRDPIVNRFTISRLERMTSGTSECPALIEHTGGADEETAKMPTRMLRLSETGEVMLALYRDGRVPGVPYPDPKPPKVKGEKEAETVKAGG